MRGAARPRGLVLDEVPPPRGLAPFTAALTAETVEIQAGTAIASGRFVVLFDPSGQDAWDGDFRVVVSVRARMDNELGTDPFLGTVAWSWLTEALAQSGAGYRALVGIVTRVLSETFGGLDLSDDCAHMELRASWSPNQLQLGEHLVAWYMLLHQAAGHEPESATALTLAGRGR